MTRRRSGRKMVMRKHGWVACAYCLETCAQVDRDHIIPRAFGGSDHVGNIAWVCRECNSAKGHELPDGVEIDRQSMARPVSIDWPVVRDHIAEMRADMSARRESKA